MSRIIDISQQMCPEMVVYPGDPRFQSRSVSSFKMGNMCEVSELTMGSHCGTHIDAPLHMLKGGAGVEIQKKHITGKLIFMRELRVGEGFKFVFIFLTETGCFVRI